MPSTDDNNRNYTERTPILHSEDSSCSSDAESFYLVPGVESFHLVPELSKQKNGSIPARYIFALLGCFGFLNVYAMRVNLNVALVAMVGQQSHYHEETAACKELMVSNEINGTEWMPHKPRTGEFDWDTSTQSLILGSFYFGYVVTQIPGGFLAERYSAKYSYGIGVLITSIFTLLTPLAARYSVQALVICRIMEGLGEGVTFPAMNALIGRWAPKMERSRMTTIIFTGSPLGTISALSISGILSASSFLGGWPSVFYVFGFLGCIWFVLWILFAFDNPGDHPRISQQELELIRRDQTERQSNVTAPWCQILSSPRVWALVVTHFGQNWAFYTMLTELPTYMANILHFDIKKNGILSSIPYISHAVLAVIASLISDNLRKTGYFKITSIRKIMNSIAFFGAAICILSITFVGCQPVIILVLLVLALGLNGFMYSGFNVTHVDMSPEFAGSLMGLTNCIANFSGFLAPAFVGKIIESGQSLHNWAIVFTVTCCMLFVTAIIYNTFGSAELQPWGTSPPVTTTKQHTERRDMFVPLPNDSTKRKQNV